MRFFSKRSFVAPAGAVSRKVTRLRQMQLSPEMPILSLHGCCQSNRYSSPFGARGPKTATLDGKRLPFGQGGRATGLVGVAVDEMAFGVEMVVKALSNQCGRVGMTVLAIADER